MNSNKLLFPSQRRRFIWATLAAPQFYTVPVGQVWEITPRGSWQGTAPDCNYITVDNHLMWWSPNANDHTPYNAFTIPDPVFQERDSMILNAQNIPVIADEGQIIEFGSYALTGELFVDIKIHKREEGINSYLDGGTNGKRKLVVSYSITPVTVLAGATVEIILNNSLNPAGAPVFPWLSVVPPQKRYKFLAMVKPTSNTVGTNCTWNALRIIHEGRSIVTMPGIVEPVGDLFMKSNTAEDMFICPDDWYFDPYESIQVYARITSTDAGPQACEVVLTIIMIEEDIGNEAAPAARE